jgi:dTDP-4-dehydrorhamnose 3,5-epimerase
MLVTKVVGFDKLFPTLITLDIHRDNRGSFTELWQQSTENIDFKPIQSNLSVNEVAGTFRGLHFQTYFPQAKLVTVIKGKIVDFLVDVRPKSETFGKFQAFWLREGDAILVPSGFAHGFLTMCDNTIINYLVDGYRFPEHERIINVLDDKIINTNGIDNLLESVDSILDCINLELTALVMSDKDKYAPTLEEIDDVTLKFAAAINDKISR